MTTVWPVLQVFNDLYDYIIMFVWPPAMMLHTITIWLTVLVTVDRYCAVCRAVERYGSGSAMLGATRRRVAVVVTLAIVYNSPRFFEHQARTSTRYMCVDARPSARPSVALSTSDEHLLPVPVTTAAPRVISKFYRFAEDS